MTKRPRAADVVARLAGTVVTSETAAAMAETRAKSAAAKKMKEPAAPPMLTLTLCDHMKAGAGVVVAPNIAERVLDRVLEYGSTFAAGPIACPEVGLDGYSMLVHPAFVRAAARRGFVFYTGPGGQVRRFPVTAEDASPKPPDKPDAKPDAKPDPSVPATDADFYLDPPWLPDLQGFVERGEPVLLIGPAGSGKSEAVEQTFAHREQPLHIVSCTQRMTANDLEGATDLVIEDGHQVTKFTPASPAIASENGDGLLLDEADAAPAEAMYAVYRLIDGRPMHILRKGIDAVIPRDPEFRVVGTQNTEGRGDDRGLYHGRSYQDEAFLDRWKNTIRVDYPCKEDEVLILRKRTGISAVQAERIVDAAQAFRNALRHDEIMLACSLRRTLAVAGNLAAGMTSQRAWEFSVLNRATQDDSTNMKSILQRIYGDRWQKTG